MKLFISWSGEFSRKVAERLSIWIQIIIQTVDVFYSPEDIEKGENWGNRLSEELEQSNFGIICLTPENVLAPWINFEAGALSKATDSRVSAVMLGISPSDIKGPLARLQNTACTREDFFRLFQSINNSSDKPLKPDVLKNAFDNSWERLMLDIDSIIKDYTSHTPAPEAETDKHEERSSDNEALQEILRIVRDLGNSRNAQNSNSAPVSVSKPDGPLDLTRYSRMSIRCAAKDIGSVLYAMRKCLSLSTAGEIDAYQEMLERYGRCYITIPEEQQDRLINMLEEIAPTVRIII